MAFRPVIAGAPVGAGAILALVPPSPGRLHCHRPLEELLNQSPT